MGTMTQMCTCLAQETVVPNSKSMIDNADCINNNEIKNDNTNTNIVDDKSRKRINNNGVKNNNQINETETCNNHKNSSNNALIITNKIQKRDSKSSRSSKKKNKEKDKDRDKKSDRDRDLKSDRDKKSDRDRDIKSDRDKNSKRSSRQKDDEEKSNNKKNKKKKEADIKISENDISKKNSINIIDNNNKEEEIYDLNNISETIISEIILKDKIKTIPKDKKKKIKGRNNINIVIIGDNEVGKSSFCIRFEENRFEDFYIPSISKENYSKVISCNGHNYKLNFIVVIEHTQIEKQDNLLSIADYFIIIYDITKIKSFNLINIYLKQLKKYIFFYDKEGNNPNFCLVGNKCDLEPERKISIENVNKCVTKYGIKHYDISVKTGKNINIIIQSFLQIFDKIAFSKK